MITKTIKALSSEDQIDGFWLDCDFIGGACDAYENGRTHINVADILAGSDNFGFAVSHIVLGAEELIKALILVFLNSDRHFISHKHKEKLFANHGFKHSHIKQFLTALTSDNMDDYSENWLDYYFDWHPNNHFQQKAYKLSHLLELGKISQQQINQISTLLDNANDLKNKGFYVDYDSNWLRPIDIDRPTYDSYREICATLIHFIQPIFSTTLTDNDELVELIYGK